MKKAMSLLFIVLANIAVLAHTALPHHHLNECVVSISDIVSEDFAEEGGARFNGVHHHDCTDSEKDCLLNDAYSAGFVLRASAAKLSHLSPDDSPSLWPALVSCLVDSGIVPSGTAFSYPPEDGSALSAGLHRHYGSRAPPVC